MIGRQKHLIRPFSWVLAAVVLCALAEIGSRYTTDPLQFVGAVIVSVIVLVVVGIIVSFVVGSYRDHRQQAQLYRARQSGLCVICGYDIRHLEGKCPECGTPISRPFHQQVHHRE